MKSQPWRGRVWALAGVCLALAACDRQETPQGLMLTYQEREPGAEAPFTTRTLVTEDFLRLDDGEESADYVVFDRDQQTIYSVDRMNESVLVIEPRAVNEEPGMPLELGEEAVALGNALPEVVEGEAAQRYRYSVNDELCTEMVTVPGLYDDAVAALSEFLTVLAGQHGDVLAMVPAEMRSGCDMATHIFAPTRHLRYGLPVWEESATGSSRRLTAHDPDWQPDPALFALPEGYERYSLGDQ